MKNIGKYLIGILVVIVLVGVAWLGYSFFKTQTAQKDQLRTVEELANASENLENREDLLIIGLDAGFPPMTFTNGKGEITGFDVDLAKKALSDVGKQLVFQPVVWSEKEADLENKKIDLLWSGVNITEERKKVFTFSKPYFTNSIIAVVARDSDILSLEDVAGKVVGNQKGAGYITDLVKEYKNSEGRGVGSIKTEFDDLPSAMTGLLLGETDVVFSDKTAVLYYTSNSPNTFRVLPGELKENKLGIAMRKGDTKMQQVVNNAIDKARSNGEYKQTYEKWFGASGN